MPIRRRAYTSAIALSVALGSLTAIAGASPVRAASLITEHSVMHGVTPSYFIALGDSFSSGEGNKSSGWVNWSGARSGNAGLSPV
jgi:hypothetical protein